MKRIVTLPYLILYGMGTTLGAGIYALVGKVAGLAGTYAPLSFLIASLLAVLSALSFAELGSRFPKSAGVPVFVQQGFNNVTLSSLLGLLVAVSGVVSAAALANGFAGYAAEFTSLDASFLIAGMILILGGIAAVGVGVSIKFAAVITIIEIVGLLLIIGSAWFAPGGEAAPAPEAGFSDFPFVGLFAGAVLAFYAFIGFEDMVTMAEEVENVAKTMPRAIIVTILLTTTLYVLVSASTLVVMDAGSLAASDAPLARVFEVATGRSAYIISLISMVAIINGALIQIMMGARLSYGMAKEGWLPKALAQVNPKTRTPLVATIGITGITLILALWFPIVPLARATSLIILFIFTMVNAALVAVKFQHKDKTGRNHFSVPLAVPVLGALVSAGVMVFELIRLL